MFGGVVADMKLEVLMTNIVFMSSLSLGAESLTWLELNDPSPRLLAPGSHWRSVRPTHSGRERDLSSETEGNSLQRMRLK